ncbi:MAG: sporulation protein YunB, partial [Oscillospiraceae bacterium]
SKLEGMVTLETNKSISHILNENSINYESFIKKSSTNDGKITGLTTDFSMVNAIKSDIAIDMQKRLDTIETVEITVPIGAMFSNTLASGVGVKIPITAIADDSVEIYFHDDFESVGINQTRHRIMVVVKVPISIAAPLKKISSEVVSEVPIAETVIVGDVPNTYMDFMK